jgi:hypothetical protein
MQAAVAKEQAEHDAQEALRIGNLRAGNSALMTEAGEILGNQCARTTLLRKLGIQYEETSADRLLMFGAGRLNEDFWVQKLRRVWSGRILLEEEIPTSWLTASGTSVTGRPDVVLTSDEAGTKPVLGLEMKMVSSVWTARDVRILGKPKLDHLIQAGHYAHQLGIPYKLVYTSYVDFAVAGWMQKQFPAYGQPGSEIIEYSDLNKKTGKREPKKVLPFYYIYDLSWGREGYLQYSVEGSREVTESPVRYEDIVRYYEFVDQMEATGQLGPRPLNVEADGGLGNWSKCDYCPLLPVCNSHEKRGLTAWLDEVTRRYSK